MLLCHVTFLHIEYCMCLAFLSLHCCIAQCSMWGVHLAVLFTSCLIAWLRLYICMWNIGFRLFDCLVSVEHKVNMMCLCHFGYHCIFIDDVLLTVAL